MQVEFFVCVDENGDVGFGENRGAAEEHYDENIGGSESRRVVRIVLDVPPFTPPTLTGAVPAEGAVAMQVS